MSSHIHCFIDGAENTIYLWKTKDLAVQKIGRIVIRKYQKKLRQ